MPKKRLGKKGTNIAPVLFIIQVLIAVGAFVALSFLVTKQVKTNIVEQQYYLRDVALTTSAAYAAPVNLYFSYEADKLDLFNYTFRNGNLLVEKTKYPYGESSDSPLSGEIKSSKDIIFISNGLSLKVGTLGLMGKKIKYGYVATKDINWQGKEIVLDGSTPVINNLAKEIEKPFLKKSAKPDIYFKLEEPAGKDIIAWINFETAEKSRKLASMVINEIIEKNQDKVGKVRIYITEEIPQAKEAGIILQKGKELEEVPLKEIFEAYYE